MTKWPVVLLLSLLVGCSSVVSGYISSRQSFHHQQLASDDVLLKQGFSRSRFCPHDGEACLGYLSAGPLGEREKLHYRVTLDVNGREETQQLQLSRDDAGRFSGTVVLIHGFRASKVFMVNSALYFRFLGFSVLLPDLLGHGESSSGMRFGVEDSELISELIDQRGSAGRPLIIVGNSLGALAATRLLELRNDIDGLLLQAPMVAFDQAAVNYMNAYSPGLSALIPDTSIREGALEALHDAGVTLEDTDIAAILARNSSTPTLIMVSASDPVSPPGAFKAIASEKVLVIEVRARSHPAMSVISQDDDALIQPWLAQVAARVAANLAE